MTVFNKNLSIYIPRVTAEWAEPSKIADVFATNNIGIVERVDLVSKESQSGNEYYEAFVHMTWSESQATKNIQARIQDPDRDARLVYDDPWYWLLLVNKNPMTLTEVRLENRIKELESQSAQQSRIALNHLNRIIEMETQVYQLQNQVNSMNYWNDPAVNNWTSHQYDNGIAPMWCHPVNQTTTTPEALPEWYTYTGGPETNKTMNDYAQDATQIESNEDYEYYENEIDQNENQNENQDNVCDYYDYEPYDMEIVE